MGKLKKRSEVNNKDNGAAVAEEIAAVWSDVFDLVDDIVTVQNDQFRILKANAAALDCFGVSADALENSYCYELFAGRSEVCSLCPFLHFSTDQHVSQVKMVHAKNGLLFDIKLSRISAPKGGNSYLFHIAKKITKTPLVETEDYFAKIFNANPLPMLVSDLQSGLLLDVNQSFLDCFGYMREEMVGHSIGTLEVLADRYQSDSLLQKMKGCASVKELALKLTTKSGELRDVFWSAEEISYGGGRVLLSLVYDYTERRKAEKEQEARERKYALVFDASPDAVNINRLEDWRFVEVNNSYLEWSGFTKKEVMGKTVEEVNLWCDPQDREEFERRLQTTGTCDSLEAKFRKKDGSVLVGVISASVVSLNNIPHAISVTRNIDTLRKVEQEHSRQKVLFETIFNSISGGVVVTNASRIIQIASKGVRRTFGYRPEELIGKSTEMLFAEHDAFQEVGEKLFTVDADKNEYPHSAKYRHRSGRIFFGEAFGAKLFNRKGKWIGNLGIVRDISSREKEEKENLMLRAAIEQVNDVVVITDYLGNITYVNPAFEKVSGYSKDEAIGRNPRLLQSGQQDKKFYDDFWQTITQGHTFSGRMVNKRKDNTCYTEEVTVSPVVDKLGNVVRYIAIKRDITGHLLLESQLQQAQKMESVGRLIGGVAHDFNNILGVILGYAGMALRNSQPTDKFYNDLKIIYDAANRSAEIVRQLMMFSRQQAVAPKIIDLNAAVEGMLIMLRRLIGEDIELVWKPQPGSLPVKIDPSQVDQILANLCVNSRDAIRGIGRLTITTEKVVCEETTPERGELFATGVEFVRLLVSDDGIGIGEDELERIFEPFFTTKAIGRGTGLGLSTVYGIVQQNHGEITVNSKKGEGTSFTISLPLSKAPLSQYKEGGLAQINKGHNETILLVEDDLTLLEMTRTMLGKTGYNVLPANGGGEALRLARKKDVKIDLILTDVVMPEMNGKELSEEVRKIVPDVKVLFMSGYTANVLGHNGILDEELQFVAKPFTGAVMSDKIREILDN